LLLRTLRAPPRRGSLQEWVLILTLYRLEDIEHARFRALAQVTIDKDKGIEAFEDYMKVAFPSLESRKKEQATEAHSALKQWVGTGPIKVTPLQMPKARSRLKERIVARMASREDRELYSKVSDEWQQRRNQ
jgi:hypothetical protein